MRIRPALTVATEPLNVTASGVSMQTPVAPFAGTNPVAARLVEYTVSVATELVTEPAEFDATRAKEPMSEPWALAMLYVLLVALAMAEPFLNHCKVGDGTPDAPETKDA